MARARKLTRAEKICVSRAGFDPTQYLCEEVRDNILLLVNKKTGKRVFIATEEKNGI